MTLESFLPVLSIGAAIEAFWLYARFPRLRPSSVGFALLHVGVAILAAQLTLSLVDPVLGLSQGPLIALFGIAFPCAVYLFLSGAWLVHAAHEAMMGVRH